MPSTTPAITRRYYPRLSEIASIDDMPAYLSFLQNGVNAIFNKIHYKNLQYTKSPNGDAAFYILDIVSNKKLSISLPGGIDLVLNPDATDANISAFPVSLQYEWGILGFINGINLKAHSLASCECEFSWSSAILFLLKKSAGGLSILSLARCERVRREHTTR